MLVDKGIPAVLKSPTKPGGIFLDALSGQSFTGIFFAYFDNETGDLVYVIATKSNSSLDHVFPADETYTTQHLRLIKHMMDKLQGG